MLLWAYIAMHMNVLLASIVLWAHTSIQINFVACLLLVAISNHMLLQAHFLRPFEPYCVLYLVMLPCIVIKIILMASIQ